MYYIAHTITPRNCEVSTRGPTDVVRSVPLIFKIGSLTPFPQLSPIPSFLFYSLSVSEPSLTCRPGPSSMVSVRRVIKKNLSYCLILGLRHHLFYINYTVSSPLSRGTICFNHEGGSRGTALTFTGGGGGGGL